MTKFVFALLMVVSCHASTVATFTQSCTVGDLPGEQTVTATNDVNGGNCSLRGDQSPSPSGAYATSSDNVTFQPGSNMVIVGVSVDVNAYDALDPSICGLSACGQGASSASAALTFSLYSSGPARMGVLVLRLNCGIYAETIGDAAGDVLFSVDGTSAGSCVSGVVTSPTPIELGGLITFSVYGSASAEGTPPATATSNQASIFGGFSASVFEADGTTPVPLTDAPEPATCLLTTTLFLLPLLRRRTTLQLRPNRGVETYYHS